MSGAAAAAAAGSRLTPATSSSSANSPKPITRDQVIRSEVESGFSFASQDENEPETDMNEMMVIEINFGKGKKGDVTVCYGDDPKELAKAFGAVHGIKENVLPIVENHIRAVMEEFITSTHEMRPQTPPLEEGTDDKSRIDNEQQHTPSLRHPAAELPPSPDVSFGMSPIPKQERPSVMDAAAASSSSSSSSSRLPPGTGGDDAGDVQSVDEIPDDDARGVGLSKPQPHRAGSSPSGARRPIRPESLDDKATFAGQGGNSESVRKPPSSSAFKAPKPRGTSPSKKGQLNTSALNTSGSSVNNITGKAEKSNESLYNSAKLGLGNSAHLLPSSKTLALNRSMGLHTSISGLQQQHNSTSGSLVTASKLTERLYRGGDARREKLDRVRKANEETELKGLKDNLYRMSKTSKALTENNRPVHEQEVTVRLYQEGYREIEKKRKQAQEKGAPSVLENWSCVRCASYHTLPLHPANNQKSGQVVRVCPVCNWETSAKPTFKPTLIGLELAGTLPYHPTEEDLLRRRQEAKSIFEQLSAGVYSTKIHIDNRLGRIKEGWKKHDLSMPFRPTIPAESTRILAESMRKAAEEAQAQSQAQANGGQEFKAGSTVSVGKYLTRPATERLSKRLKPTPRRIVNLPESPKQAPRPSHEVEAFVNRLVFEYRDREARRAVLADRFYSIDGETLKPLWKPSIGPPPPSGGVSVTSQVMRGADGSMQKRDIVDVLYAKDKRRQERLDALVKEKQVKVQKQVDGPDKVHALEASEKILQDAMDRSIEEMFRLLYVATTGQGISPGKKITSESATTGGIGGGVSIAEDLQRAQSISHASEVLGDWQSLKLDLSLVQPDMMIPEVTTLLQHVVREARALREKSISNPSNGKGNGSSSGSNGGKASARIDEILGGGSKNGSHPEAMPTSYTSFYKLVKKALAARDGVGRYYLYAPRKKPEIAIQMIIEEQKQETFHPVINENSQAIAKAKRMSMVGASSEEFTNKMLARDAHRAAQRVEAMRKEKEEKDARELTFRPTLRPLPRGVTPKYRGVKEAASTSVSLDASMVSTETDQSVNAPPPAPTNNSRKPVAVDRTKTRPPAPPTRAFTPRARPPQTPQTEQSTTSDITTVTAAVTPTPMRVPGGVGGRSLTINTSNWMES